MSTQTPLPLFYSSIEAFDVSLHGNLCRPAPADYSFAAKAAIVPLLVAELPFAIRHYPVVFVTDPADLSPTLAAVVGLGDERNLFVDERGAWRAGTYVPAYVRRYPFHALRVEGQSEPLLAIDPAYKAAVDGAKLVNADGEPSQFLTEMLALTRDYMGAAERTLDICRALQAAGVLEDAEITLRSANGDQHTINGFLKVSEERLRALSNEDVLKLHQADAFGLAYAQLFSLANLTHLPLAPLAQADSKLPKTRKK